MNSKYQDFIFQAYTAFNRQDIKALLAFISDGVSWPDDDDDHRLHGKDAVRAYWLKKWETTRPYDKPVAISALSEEVSVVRIEQLVYDLDGAVISEGIFEHTFEIKDRLIVRMDLTKL
ncbi:MAG: nuclear transport factor 2 family protein [Phormidesmis sp.]